MTVMEIKTTLNPPPEPPPPGLGNPEIIWPWVKFIERRRAARKAAAEAKERGDSPVESAPVGDEPAGDVR